MLNSNIFVKTESFDGPLGLLLLLIQKEEMDVRALDINKITHQYLEYLDRMQELNFDMAGDYLYMAATLVFLKSKSYVSEDDVRRMIGDDVENDLHITSQAELIKRLEELKKYQELGQQLWGLSKHGHEVFTKPKVNRKKIVDSILNPMDLQELTNQMIDLIRREKKKYKLVKRDRLSIKEKLQFLKFFLKIGIPTNFFEILEKDQGETNSRDNTVITFISLLELARLKKISIFQNQEFENIFIKVKESLESFNVELADGFEDENEENNEVPAQLVANANQEQPAPETTLQ